MAYTTINKSTAHFNTKLYSGTGSTNAITGVGFAPDMTWIKVRTTNYDHQVVDQVRGYASSVILPNQTNVEYTGAVRVDSRDSDGFTVSTPAQVNASSNNFVSWNWKANGAGSANTDGSINSTVSVNTTSGFSIVKYVATGSNATVGHGLGVAPAMIIFKNLDSARSWAVGHNGLTNWSYHNYLDATNGENSDNTMFQGTAPTNTVFSVGTAAETNESGDNFIAYCFAEKTGYSKFGSYTGNNSASDGTFVYTGFRPSFVMVKRTQSTGNSWRMFDNKRDGFNGDNANLHANLNIAEDAGSDGFIDLFSNGFRPRTTSTDQNASGGTYIYMAFGQSIVGSNNVPCTAR